MATDGVQLPVSFDSVEALEEFLSRPSVEVVEAVRQLEGDVLILGAGGKMGPTLATMAQRAVQASGIERRVIAVSRFSDQEVAGRLRAHGVETVACDLMAPGAIDALPEVRNLIYMVGHKFGATGQEGLTWTLNAFLPGLVARRYREAQAVVFSSGNVYPLTPLASATCREDVAPGPIGEYAQSVLGRERVYSRLGGRSTLFRLNYAVELRYGVLVDIAQRVWAGEPVDVHMGYVNVIWQGDANAYALRALRLASTPPCVLNVTGPELLSVRSLALQFGELMGRTPVCAGSEAPDALLSTAQKAFTLLGYPKVPVGKVIQWVAAWVMGGGLTHAKPTKFQVRDGRF
ncbi:MAG: epimerase [Anaerolineae bacterium]|nr:epimerase [Anaerolineae bacterium]